MADGLSIRFKSTPVTLPAADFDTRVVTRKPIRFVRHGSTVPKDGVGIAFLSIPPISRDNLTIKNLGPDYIENSEATHKVRSIDHNNFITTFRKFLVTDLRALGEGGVEIPLFYKHDLSAETSVSEPKVFDKNMNEMPKTEWSFDEANRVLYHGYEFSVDEATGSYEAWTISYIDANDQRKSLLLHQDPTYLEHTLEMGPVDPTKRTYLVQDIGAGYTVTINFPADPQKYWFKGILDGQIQALPPAETHKDDSWFVRVTNGEIYVTTDQVRRFHVPEWHDQAFLPLKPYRYAAYNRALKVSRRLVRVPRWPLEINTTESRYIDIVITNELGEPKRGYTNDPNKVFWRNESGRVISLRLHQLSGTDITWSQKSGFIHLDVDLDPTDEVLVSHYYEERFMEYLGVNFNPIFNANILGKRVILYAKPNVPAGAGQKGLYHLIFDERTMQVTEYNDPGLSNNGLSTALADLQEKYKTYLNFRRNTSGLLWIASLATRRTSSPEDIESIDTRVRGGGLREDQDKAALLRQFPDLAFLPDFANWDGRPFPGRATAWVELPHHLLTGKGSLGDGEVVLTESDVREIVKRHMPLGSYPLIRWYGDRPKITSLKVVSLDTTSTVTLKWTSVPGATSYKVYSADSLDAPFEEVSDVKVLTSTFTLDYSVYSARPAYFYVVPLFDGNEGLKSDIIFNNLGDVDSTWSGSAKMDAILTDPYKGSATFDAVLV